MAAVGQHGTFKGIEIVEIDSDDEQEEEQKAEIKQAFQQLKAAKSEDSDSESSDSSDGDSSDEEEENPHTAAKRQKRDQPEPASVSATFSVDDLKLALATLSPGEYAKLFWAMAPNIREEDVECEPGKGFTMPVLEKIAEYYRAEITQMRKFMLAKLVSGTKVSFTRGRTVLKKMFVGVVVDDEEKSNGQCVSVQVVTPEDDQEEKKGERKSKPEIVRVRWNRVLVLDDKIDLISYLESFDKKNQGRASLLKKRKRPAKLKAKAKAIAAAPKPIIPPAPVAPTIDPDKKPFLAVFAQKNRDPANVAQTRPPQRAAREETKETYTIKAPFTPSFLTVFVKYLEKHGVRKQMALVGFDPVTQLFVGTPALQIGQHSSIQLPVTASTNFGSVVDDLTKTCGMHGIYLLVEHSISPAALMYQLKVTLKMFS